MNPIRSRHIGISLIVAFIIFILVKANQDNHPDEYYGAHTPLKSHTSYPPFDRGQLNSQNYHNSSSNSNIKRHEILQKKMKGYREKTYWGLEHPTQERTRYMDSDEFQTYMREEIEEKVADVYWGAEF